MNAFCEKQNTPTMTTPTSNADSNKSGDADVTTKAGALGEVRLKENTRNKIKEKEEE